MLREGASADGYSSEEFLNDSTHLTVLLTLTAGMHSSAEKL
jgi:hypothetical protein